MRTLMFFLLLVCPVVHAQQPFTVGGNVVDPGSQASLLLPAPSAKLPVTVIHGAYPGPVLLLTAGVHGDEFPALFALQRLRSELDPAVLHGTVMLVHLANPSGFHGRRIALNPLDDKNLNREFPGDRDGTATEQLAHYFTQTLIPLTDYLIDLHSGSQYQTLLPHVYSPVLYDTVLDERTLAFAQATGLKHVVLYDERPNDPANSISLPNTAQTRGKPALTIEVGDRGDWDEADIAQMVNACRNAMRHLGMLDIPHEVADDSIRLYSRLVEVESPVTGMFQPRSQVGDTVATAALLGIVTDYFGETIAEIRAPSGGTVLMLHATPAISAGETPATIGISVSMP